MTTPRLLRRATIDCHEYEDGKVTLTDELTVTEEVVIEDIGKDFEVVQRRLMG